MRWVRRIICLLALLFAGPAAVAIGGEVNLARDWRLATRQSSGLAPSPDTAREAVVQVYAARTFGWRGVVAVHSWISVKPENGQEYTTYEVIGWRAFYGGSALQIHNGGPDRYWFGSRPELLVDLRGAEAAQAIRDIEVVVKAYPYPDFYRTWPGPNSNTFTAFVGRRVPALKLDLPPTAIGKDYLGPWSVVDRSPSGGGIQVSLFGLLGFIASVEEGIEVNVLGLAFGIDPADLAVRLPGIGKLGM